MVISVLGADRAGLVEALSGAVASTGGNWERSRMAELGGTFAGIVLVRIPADSVDALTAELQRIESTGLLHISTAEATAEVIPGTASGDADRPDVTKVSMRLVGQDHPGIVHEISQALAGRHVSIDELETAVVPAPMGGMLFQAEATLELPAAVTIDEVRDLLEALAQDLMVDLEVSADSSTGSVGPRG